MADLDAVVVGAGPNGLAAAVTLARAGLRVRVFERETHVGGGSSTAELTLPGFLHDVCSAVHPLALASPFFREFALASRIELLVPEISYAHPLDDGRAGIVYRELSRTGESLGADGAAWRRLLGWMAHHDDAISSVSSTSLVRFPRHPFALAALGLRALEQGGPLWNIRFRSDVAPALLTGVLAHANRRLPDLAAAAAGLVLAAHAHAGGWPIPVGGSQAIIDAMVADFVAHGGTIETGVEITALEELPETKAVILDVTPRALRRLAGSRLKGNYGRRFRYGSAVAKVDYAVDGPVPWSNPELRDAVSLHLGGSRTEIHRAEGDVAAGRIPDSPFLVLSQPSVLDATRAPAGKHVVWAYTHVPTGSAVDREDAVTRQIERFAPGFRDLILASATSSAVQVEEHNPNYIRGDISSGDVSFGQLLARPRALDPWSTPLDGVYLCSASTSPGPGVHGMGGYHAARRALAREFGVRELPALAP